MSGYPSTLAFVPTHPYRTTLYSNDTMTVKLSMVTCNTQKGAKVLKVTTKSTLTCSGSPATIEESTDSNNWVAVSAAKLGDPRCVIESQSSSSVCTSSTVRCTLTPYLDVNAGSKVVLDLEGIALSSAPTPSYISLDSWTASQIVATTTNSWLGTKEHSTYISTFSFSGITLPSTETPFRFRITTYALGATVDAKNVVHQDTSAYINAIRRKFRILIVVRVETTTSLKTMSAPLVLKVSTLATYVISMKSVCGLSVAATFAVKFPSVFTANSATCAADCTIGAGSSSIILKNKPASSQGGDVTFTFTLLNPTAARPVSATFAVIASDLSSSSVSFEYITSLPDVVVYESGEFTSLSIIPGSYKAMAACEYKLTIAVNHKVPSGSSIVITLPSSVTVGGTSATVNSNAKSYTISGQVLNLASATNQDYESGSTILVVLPSITNPSQTGTLSFTVLVQFEGYDIDKGTTIVNINLPADATVACALQDPINTVQTIYTCSFIPPSSLKLPLSTDDLHYLDVELATDIPGCIPSSTLSSSSLSYLKMIDSKNFTLFIKSTIAASSLTSLDFALSCTNPPSTKPSTMSFTLYTGTASKKPILCGVATIQTTAGLSLSSGGCSADQQYPSYPTNVTLDIARSTYSTAKIKRIYLSVPSIVSTSKCLVTDFSPSSYTCGYVTGNSNGNLMVEFGSATAVSSFKLTMVGSKNPSSPADTSLGYFKVRTFAYDEDAAKEYLVDQSDSVCMLSVVCTSPCKTCELGASSICTSCSTVETTKYYYFPGLGKCDVESACVPSEGFFKDEVGLRCQACVSPCKLCSGSANYCTSCLVDSKFVLDGACVDSCPDKYYTTGIEDKLCKPCTSPCYNCNGAATTCTSCVSGTYFIKSSSKCSATCPDGQYGADGVCKDCDLASCCTCQHSATDCTSCGCLSKFLYSRTCIHEDVCNAMKTYVAVPATSKCSACEANCLECTSGSTTKCTKCIGTTALSGTTCVEKCGTQEYTDLTTEVRQCLACSSNCYTCAGKPAACTSCSSGMFLDEATNRCVSSCGSNYYVTSTGHCVICSTSCLTCSGDSMSCTSCEAGMYVYNSRCVSGCPTATYMSGKECFACNSTCAACSGSATACISCAAGYYLDGTSCVSACSGGKAGISGVCQSCTGECKTCTGTVDYCTSCKTDVLYLSAGTCVSSCPSGTLPSLSSSSERICVDCDRGCAVCAWTNSSNQTLACVQCSTGYLMLESKCYSPCPTGYFSSSDGLSCAKDGDGANSTKSESSAHYVAFPHLISAGALIFVAVAGQVRDPRSMLVGNTIMMWSYITVCSYILQIITAAGEGEGTVLGVSAAIVAISVALNVLFLFWHKKRVESDKGFLGWTAANVCTKKWIKALCGICNLQTARIYYSRFIGFSLFFVPFADFANVLDPLAAFSFFQVILAYFPMIVLDIVALSRLSWGTQLYITLIESLILSVLLILLLCYEMKQSKTLRADLADDAKYTRVREETTMMQSFNKEAGSSEKTFDEDELRKRILEDVFSRLGLVRSERSGSSDTWKDASRTSLLTSRTGKGRPRRRHSFSGRTGTDKQEDEREAHSYPCSPKTAKSKEVPQWEEEAKTRPHELPDNVYSESKPASELSSPAREAKEMVEAGAQTPPFKKLLEFKKHLKSEERRRRRKNKKLFEPDANGEHMLEPIAETPDDNDENGPKRPTLEGEQISLPSQPNPIDDIKPGELKSVVLVRDTSETRLEFKENVSATNAKIFPADGEKETTKPEQSSEPVNISDIANDERHPKEQRPDNNDKENRGHHQASVSVPPRVPPANPENEGPIIIDALETAGPSMGEQDGSKAANKKRRHVNVDSPPQSAHETNKPVLGATLNPDDFPEKLATKANVGDNKGRKKKEEVKTFAEVQKTPELFDENSGFKFSIANLKSPKMAVPVPVANPPPTVAPEEIKSSVKEMLAEKAAEDPEFVEEEEIMGSLDRDPEDNTMLLIRENEAGELVDLRGRKVNRSGYLVDKEGNIINRKGEIMLRYDEIAKEPGEDDIIASPGPAVQTNNLFDQPIENPHAETPEGTQNPAVAQEREQEAEAEVHSDSQSHKSASVSSLMGDTPSNYNLQNQRYEDPLDNLRRKKTFVPNARKLVPAENDASLSLSNNTGPVRRLKRKNAKSQSANRRRAEKLFSVKAAVDNNNGFTSDAEGKQAPPRPRPRELVQRPPEISYRQKPKTARSNLRAAPAAKRAKSRKVTRRDCESNNNEGQMQMQKVYNAPIEGMFLYSDKEEDDVSVAPSNVSSKQLMPKLKGLEGIYLQRLESSTKRRRKREVLARKATVKRGRGESLVPEGESEHDEISSMLSENFNAMQNQFMKQNATQAESSQRAEDSGIFPGNMKLYQQP